MSEQLLETSITYLKGVGPSRAKALEKELSIKTFGDLLYYFPFRHEDRTKFYKISEVYAALPYVQLIGEITYLEEIGASRKKRLLARFKDESGSIDLIWFKAVSYLKKSLAIGVKYVVFGKPNSFQQRINIVHPEMELFADYKNSIQTALEPVYPSTEALNRNGLSSKGIVKLSRILLPKLKGNIPEILPQKIIQDHQLMGREAAVLNMHFPKDAKRLEAARERIKFEELFMIQIDLLKLKLLNTNRSVGFVFSEVGSYFNQFYAENLPFELTGAQKKVVKEIRNDLRSGKQMNRLLQGDVGSGKTIVAAMSILFAIGNGFQATFMAPTEILAKQHYASIIKLFEGLNIKVALLTGSSKTAERRAIDEALQSGELHLLIGTHALLEDKVKFNNLGLAVIDEQHRFGVAQRAKLYLKNTQPPHVLIMTATPIPRTLSMTLYGDLEVSVIDELPPGRKDIKTVHWYESKRLRLFGFLEEEIKKGRQVYVVYPLIEESEKMDYANLESGYEHLFKRFPPPEYKVSIVHGRMPADTKSFEMNRFVKGETNIMVSTTVIEVGVDVPNASVMVIESAERFGLSQLHQLRGRVGRGAEQSYCILMTGNKLSSDGRLRMKTMSETNDGFKIAEVDMRLRGPGDLQGTQQSGTPFNLKVANLTTDGETIVKSRDAAKALLEEDPKLEKAENAVLINYLRTKNKGKTNWSKIS